ncbi:serine/threonine-protein kinase [Nonomuraea wenchangensis]
MLPLLTGDPAKVGPFQLVGRLGSGGMGTVFAGVTGRGERAAVKLIHPSLANDQEFRARFAREVAVLRRMHSFCTALVLDADTAGPRPWLATEYVPGPTLERRLQSGGPLSEDELYGLAGGLAEALVAMHGAAVVHRDLKPANVILSPGGPKVIDFGIARVLDDTALTRTGTLVGSPGWLSPEEYRGEPAGPAADVYNWGLLIAHAASGLPPFGTGRPEVLALRVLNDAVHTDAVPGKLRKLVERALAKQPGPRPSSAELLAGVAEAWRRDGETAADEPVDFITQRIHHTWVMPVGDEQPWPLRRRRVRKWWVAAGVVSILLASAALINTVTDPGTSPRQQKVVATTVPRQVPAVAATATPSGADTTDAPATSWQGLRIPLPPGWKLGENDESGAELLAPGEKTHVAGLVVTWLGAPHANTWPTDVLDQDSGWHVGDPPYCMAPGSTEQDLATRDGKLIRREQLTLNGGYRAEYRVWDVPCENGSRFTTKAWYIPEAELVLYNLAADVRYGKEYDEIVAGLDLTGWKPEIPEVAETFRGMKMVLPAGWSLKAVSGRVACISSPSTKGSSGPWALACPPDSLVIEVNPPNGWPGEELGEPIPNDLAVRSPCLAGGGVTQIHDDEAAELNPAGAVSLYEGLSTSRVMEAGKLTTAKLADGRRAAYRSWRMSCEFGRTYTTKIWYLPVSKVALYVLSQHPEDVAGHKKIIKSLNLADLNTR